jgi:hypothetical protein
MSERKCKLKRCKMHGAPEQIPARLILSYVHRACAISLHATPPTTRYHPINSQLFMFSSSCGQLKLGDLRRGAICTEFKSFHEADNDQSKPFFSEIVASISDVKFSRDGRYAISRDYLRVRVWDLAMPHKAVRTIPVNSNLQSKLIELCVVIEPSQPSQHVTTRHHRHIPSTTVTTVTR